MSARLVAVYCILLSCIQYHPVQAQSAPDPQLEQKVNSLVSQLSLEEKIDLIGGSDGMYIRAEPKIGLPALKMSDGPFGVRTWGASTAYAAGIGLAAAWDPELAKKMGASIGQDARARGVNFLLGPGVNIYRAPLNGRNFEYFGEDPYLAARTTVGYIEGVQSQGVCATVKHFALNNQEYDRHGVSSDASERTIREIYLPAFEAAVREAHTCAVMNSYNLVNGVHATQNGWLNNQVLKKDWGFDGVLMSDWASTYDGVAAANGGLDLEMPTGDHMNRPILLSAIQQGKVSVETIDDKVKRILRVAIRSGFMDREQEVPGISLLNQEGRQVALDEAREGITLLKNDGELLPFNTAKVKTLAVIGPDAWPAVTGGGGSSTVTPFAPVSLLEGLSRIPSLKVLYSAGLPSLDDLFQQTHYEPVADKDGTSASGVKVETFGNRAFSGPSASTSNIDSITFWRPLVWTAAAPITTSVRYTANYLPHRSGSHLFVVAGTASDGYALYVNGKKVLEQASRESQSPLSVEVELKKDVPASIRLDYLPGASDPRISLGIRAIDDLISPEALKIAALSDAVVVSVGFNATTESEGFDRPYALPYGQDALIEAVKKVNSKTVVTLTAGGEVDTSRWINKVPAFIDLWYPGQEGGTALAEILFGKRSPEGKLPISFAKSWEDSPVYANYYPASAASGEGPHVNYSEGVFLGYRYYTSRNKSVLFPFGFGLTYTTFDIRNLKIVPESIASPNEPVEVSFDVTNTGKIEGADVAQLYVGDPSAKLERPVKELKGFAKVRLEPGQTQHVTLTLHRRDLSYWDDQGERWRVDPGQFNAFVGDSSENTPLQGKLTVQTQ